MYAIVETGGKQYRVKPGDVIDIERLSDEVGSTFDLGRVLMVGGNGESKIGVPALDDAVVKAEVLEHPRGEKVLVFHFKAKARIRRKTGHRQNLTRLRIKDIVVGGVSASTRS